MKIISLSLLCLFLNISLLARENPFQPTDHFIEQKEIILEANKQAKINQEKQEKLEKDKNKQIMIEKKALVDKKALQMIQEKKEKVIVTETPIIKKEVYVPQIKQNFKILPFVKIYVIDDVVTIKVDTKYKLLNQDILRPDKKLLFDFEGDESFYTIRKEILSDDFKSLTVGTHIKEHYFRVVIDLPTNVSDYIENINSKEGIITIQKR